MIWPILILAALFIVLFLSWTGMKRREPARSENHVYVNGKTSLENPDSDADMQEQYDFRKNTNP